MKSLGCRRNAAIAGVAAVWLAGCGGSQPPIGEPGAMPQSRAVATHANRGGSWMLPEAKVENLLYASDERNSAVWVYSYPDGKQVGELKDFPAEPSGLCSDSTGNVYVTTQGDGTSLDQSYIYKYAHGGTKPIATLSDPGLARGCAVDAITGNLAVSNLPAPYGNLAVYQDAQGEPTTYSDPNFEGFALCAYDDAGNLFADGGPENVIAMLPKGGSTLTEIQLSQDINSGSIQWANNHLVIAYVYGSPDGDQLLYNVQISGTMGSVQGSIDLSSSRGRRVPGLVQFWIQGRTIIGPGYAFKKGLLQFWKYPQGGLPTKVIKPDKGPSRRVFFGTTVSLAPRHA